MLNSKLVKIAVNTKAKIHTKPPRKIYMYKKGNMEGIQSDLTSSFKKFEEDSNEEDVETTWTNFRYILTETIERNIPSKYTTTRWNLLWMTTEIKQMIRDCTTKPKSQMIKNTGTTLISTEKT